MTYQIIQRTEKNHPLYDPSLGGYIVASCESIGDMRRLMSVLNRTGFSVTPKPSPPITPPDGYVAAIAPDMGPLC